MNSEQTCEWCRYSDQDSRVCRRRPPVPLTEHSGKMRLLNSGNNDHLVVVRVYSAYPATTPGNTCGEWAPESVSRVGPDLLDQLEELREIFAIRKDLKDMGIL